MTIREAVPNDAVGVWPIFQKIISGGDSFAFPADTAKEEFISLWFSSVKKAFVAEEGGIIKGSYYIKPNQPGLGAHIANCSYLVDPDARGRGTGDRMCRHSLQTAKDLGYRGMQFNIVVSTNTSAVELWKRNGFRIIGTTPGGFRHISAGYVDTLIMFREID